MSYKVLLFLLLGMSLIAAGQTGTGNQPVSSPQTWNNTSGQSVPLGNGLGSTSGTAGYYGEGAAGGTLLSTPTATFDSPAPTAGISNTGRAGISDASPVNPAVQSTLGGSTLVYSNVPADMAMPGSPATAAVSPERAKTDLGPSFYSTQVGTIRNEGPSLGEIATHYQQLQPVQGLRTYTNADVRPTNNRLGNENSVLAANMPPVLGQSGTSSASPSGARSSPPAQTAETSTGTEAPNAATNDRLPATFTFLPLLTLLGVTSSGLGLLLRKRRG